MAVETIMKNLPAIIGLWVFSTALCHSQGFINFGFEDATIVADTSRGNPYIYANSAIPGWTAYISGVSIADIVYNTISLADPAITLQGPNNAGSYVPPRGSYFILLEGQWNGGDAFHTNSASIGQTGQIPINAVSMTFWGFADASTVSFAGQTLPLTILGTTANNYNIYGTDISMLAGQTGELMFTAQYGRANQIDNIRFSTLPVPEPGSLALLVAGVLLASRTLKRP